MMLLSIIVIQSVIIFAKAETFCGTVEGHEYYCYSGTSCCGVVNNIYQCCSWNWNNQWYIWVGVILFVAILSICLSVWRRHKLKAMLLKRPAPKVEVTTKTYVNGKPQSNEMKNPPPSYVEANDSDNFPSFNPNYQPTDEESKHQSDGAVHDDKPVEPSAPAEM